MKGNIIYLFTGYEDNSKFFVPETETIPEAQPRVIVVVEMENLLLTKEVVVQKRNSYLTWKRPYISLTIINTLRIHRQLYLHSGYVPYVGKICKHFPLISIEHGNRHKFHKYC